MVNEHLGTHENHAGFLSTSAEAFKSDLRTSCGQVNVLC